MSKKTSRRIINSDKKIKLQHKQLPPEAAEELSTATGSHVQNFNNPFELSDLSLSLPRIHHQQDLLNNEEDNEFFCENVFKVCDSESYDTDSSSWDQSVTSFMSWSDEIEYLTTEKVQKLMDDVECILYDEPFESKINKEVINECKLWKHKFPHLRIKGNAVKPGKQPKETEEDCNFGTQEEIFAINGREYESYEESYTLPEKTSEAKYESDDGVEKPNSETLKQMVKNNVLEQLISYIISQVRKQFIVNESELNKSLKTKYSIIGSKNLSAKTYMYQQTCSESTLPSDISTLGPSDSESESDSFLAVSSKILQKPKRQTPRSDKCLKVGQSSDNSYYVGSKNGYQQCLRNEGVKYQSFSVISSAPLRFPSPEDNKLSLNEIRSYHSAAERRQTQHGDRRFSCGSAANDVLLYPADKATSKREWHKLFKTENHSNEQFQISKTQAKLTKHIVLPPIDSYSHQKMTLSSHDESEALDITGIGFSSFSTAQQLLGNVPQKDDQKKRRQARRKSYQ